MVHLTLAFPHYANTMLYSIRMLSLLCHDKQDFVVYKKRVALCHVRKEKGGKELVNDEFYAVKPYSLLKQNYCQFDKITTHDRIPRFIIIDY